jgi:FemAB-related protein (PEP-CTERM system-associated)
MEIKKSLEQKAIEVAESLNVNYLELRQLQQPDSDSWPCKRIYYTFRKNIDADSEVNLQMVPRKQRAMIRKGIKANLYSVVDNNIDRFYSIYSTSVRNLGSPVQSRKYFQILYDTFAGKCDVLTVEKSGKPISSVFSFYYGDTVLPYYGGGLPEARQYKAYDFMYWELMRRSCEKGIRQFDFGRSIEGSGSFDFKKNWGFHPEPLYYRQYLVKARHTPEFNPDNPRYRFYVNLWKYLPLPVANRLGPVISRGLV